MCFFNMAISAIAASCWGYTPLRWFRSSASLRFSLVLAVEYGKTVYPLLPRSMRISSPVEGKVLKHMSGKARGFSGA